MCLRVNVKLDYGLREAFSLRAHHELLWNDMELCSDGRVKVWRWVGSPADEEDGALTLSTEHVLEAHRYPALACDFGAAGSVLLSAGLDGCAYLWDVQVKLQRIERKLDFEVLE